MSKVSILKPADKSTLAAILHVPVEPDSLRIWRLSYWSTLFNPQAVREPCSATVILNSQGSVMAKQFRPGVALHTGWGRMTAEDLQCWLGLDEPEREWTRDEQEEEREQAIARQQQAEERRKQLDPRGR